MIILETIFSIVAAIFLISAALMVIGTIVVFFVKLIIEVFKW